MKIVKNGFEFICNTKNEIAMVMNFFKRNSTSMSPNGEAPTRVRRYGRGPKRSWTESQIGAMKDHLRAGHKTNEIVADPIFSGHTRAATVTEMYVVRKML